MLPLLRWETLGFEELPHGCMLLDTPLDDERLNQETKVLAWFMMCPDGPKMPPGYPKGWCLVLKLIWWWRPHEMVWENQHNLCWCQCMILTYANVTSHGYHTPMHVLGVWCDPSWWWPVMSLLNKVLSKEELQFSNFEVNTILSTHLGKVGRNIWVGGMWGPPPHEICTPWKRNRFC